MSDDEFDGMFFGLDGEPITLTQWAVLMGDPSRRRIARDVVEGVEVSTVHTGFDYNFMNLPGREPVGPHLIFETMTFAHVEELDCWCYRWPTRERAEHGHLEVCEKVRAAVHEHSREQ